MKTNEGNNESFNFKKWVESLDYDFLEKMKDDDFGPDMKLRIEKELRKRKLKKIM